MPHMGTEVKRSAAIPWLQGFAIFSVLWGMVVGAVAVPNWFLALAQLFWGVMIAVMAIQITRLLERLGALEDHLNVNLDEEVARRKR